MAQKIRLKSRENAEGGGASYIRDKQLKSLCKILIQ